MICASARFSTAETCLAPLDIGRETFSPNNRGDFVNHQSSRSTMARSIRTHRHEPNPRRTSHGAVMRNATNRVCLGVILTRVGGAMPASHDSFYENYAPFTDVELLEAFRSSRPTAPHLLVWYSLIIGVNAKMIVDLGIGNSTRTARAAARVTGGTVYSCDHNRVNFSAYDGYTQDEWHFTCAPAQEFLPLVPDPIDVAFHDASHDHDDVRDDLLALFPKMRLFGLICVHDTQHPRYTLLEAVSEAIDAAAGTQRFSCTTLPYGAGLSILRAETGIEPPIVPVGHSIGERVVTTPRPHPIASMHWMHPMLNRDYERERE